MKELEISLSPRLGSFLSWEGLFMSDDLKGVSIRGVGDLEKRQKLFVLPVSNLDSCLVHRFVLVVK